MSNQTLFFILGISLVVVALVVSFAGLRFKNFPSSRVLLLGGVAFVALLVAATATFAWRNGEDEQAKKADELAAEASANEASGNTTEADEEQGPGATTTASTSTTTTTSGTTVAGNPQEGSQLFSSQGCSGCHTLAAAGSSGTTGPNLDGALKGKTPDFIKTSIIDPNADIAQGYPPDVMPQNFGEVMSPEQIDSLVAYLVESTSGKSQ